MSNVATKAKKPNLSVKSVLNWILDHAMIIVIVLLALYVQTQRDAFLKPASLINIISLTAARLPMALGVAGCIILAGTDLTGGRVAGLTAFVAAILLQRADVANRVLAGGAPANIVLVLLLVMLIGACVGLINGFVMAKFKVHPYIITLAMQMIVYGIYLTVSNSVQVGSFDSSYTTSFVTKPLFQIQTGVRPNGTAIFTVVPMYVLLALIVTALMWVVWNKTAFGKNMFAVGSNEEAARVSGVNVMMTIIGVFHGRWRSVRLYWLHRSCPYGFLHCDAGSELRSRRHFRSRYRRRIVRRRHRQNLRRCPWRVHDAADYRRHDLPGHLRQRYLHRKGRGYPVRCYSGYAQVHDQKVTVSRCNGAESLVPSAFKHASQRLCTSCTEPLALSLWKEERKQWRKTRNSRNRQASSRRNRQTPKRRAVAAIGSLICTTR